MGSRLLPWILLLLVGCGGPGTAPDAARLEGRWRSDAGKTLRWIKSHRTVRPEVLEEMAPRFGRMTVEYTGSRVVAGIDGEQADFDLEVVGGDHDSLAVLTVDPITEQREILLIRFEDENTYSVYIEPLEIREFFVRTP